MEDQIQVSLDKDEFSIMVNSVREAELAIGKIDYTLSEKQKQGRKFSDHFIFQKMLKKGNLLLQKYQINSTRIWFAS